jgi:hypothetical protein
MFFVVIPELLVTLFNCNSDETIIDVDQSDKEGMEGILLVD